MFGIPRARLVGYVLAGCFALGVVCWWPSPSEPSAYDAQLRTIWHRKMAQDASALRAADSALAARDGTVTRVITTYHVIRDTARITDTVWVKQMMAQSDSVVRACTELQNACAVYRVRAESVIADLHVENDALRAEVKAIHGSRIVNAWNKIKLPLAFGAGLYLGAKAVR